MDWQVLLNIATLSGAAFAVYLGLRRLPGEIRRNDASTINDLTDVNSKTIATNAVLQERIEKLQLRLDEHEKLNDLKDARIKELEAITKHQEAKIFLQDNQIVKLQAEILELQRTTNGHGHTKGLSS